MFKNLLLHNCTINKYIAQFMDDLKYSTIFDLA